MFVIQRPPVLELGGSLPEYAERMRRHIRHLQALLEECRTQSQWQLLRQLIREQMAELVQVEALLILRRVARMLGVEDSATTYRNERGRMRELKALAIDSDGEDLMKAANQAVSGVVGPLPDGSGFAVDEIGEGPVQADDPDDHDGTVGNVFELTQAREVIRDDLSDQELIAQWDRAALAERSSVLQRELDWMESEGCPHDMDSPIGFERDLATQWHQHRTSLMTQIAQIRENESRN